MRIYYLIEAVSWIVDKEIKVNINLFFRNSPNNLKIIGIQTKKKRKNKNIKLLIAIATLKFLYAASSLIIESTSALFK